MTSQFLRLLFIALLACLTVVPAATAQTDASSQDILSKEYDRCIDSSAGYDSNMLDCGAEVLGRLDSMLNQAYRALMHSLPVARQKQLRNSERHWLAQRRRECRHEAQFDEPEFHGTLADVIYQICIAESTEQRLTWVRKYPH